MSFNYSSTRADVNPLPSPWETLNASGLFVTSNTIKGNSGDSVSGYLSSVENYSDDQFCEVAYSNYGDADNPGAGVRCQNSAGLTGYFAVCNTDRVYLMKYLAGVPTTIAAPLTAFTSPIRIEVETSGSDALITVTQNGVPISGSPFTDSVAPITGGQPAGYYSYGNTRTTSITNISGGDTAAAAGGLLLRRRR